MAKIFGQLEKAQLENTTSDTGSLPKGMATYRTDLNIAKVSNGTSMLALVDESSAQTLTGKTYATPTFTGPFTMSQEATPANPSAGNNKFYFKADGKLYTLDSSGTEEEVGAGAGGGNVFSGNTNLSGSYYGDVIVYGGNVTITGNLIVHGNLIVDGSVSCTGDFSISIKNDMYVEKFFDYLPATGGQDIIVGGDLTVLGETIITNTPVGPYDIINIVNAPGSFGAAEITMTGYPDPGIINFTLETGSTNAPFTDLVAGILTDYFAPGTSTILLDSAAGTEVDLTDTWGDVLSVTTYKNINIRQNADKKLVVRGNLRCQQFTGKSAAGATRGLNVFVGGDLLPVASFPAVQNPEFTIAGDAAGGKIGGELEVKGCVYDYTITTSGAGATVPGAAGRIILGGFYGPSSNIVAQGGSAVANVAAQNGLAGGAVTINGNAIFATIDVKGGAAQGSGGTGNGGNGGQVIIYGHSRGLIITSGGEAIVNGSGGSGGALTMYGNHSGAITSSGGFATGATRVGGSGGTVTGYGVKSGGAITLLGGQGVSSANGGGGGTLLLYGSLAAGGVIGDSINMYGGAGVTGASGGAFSVYGTCDFGTLNNYGGNSSGALAGGRGGQIFTGSFVSAAAINAHGGSSISGVTGSPAVAIQFLGGINVSDFSARDGLTGTASTNTTNITIGGPCSFGTMNVANRAQVQIRGYSLGAPSLRVRVLSAKDVFNSATGTNPTAAQAALCAARTYIYNGVTLTWQFSAFANA